VLDHVGGKPFAEFRTCSCGKIGTNRKQFLQCLFGSLAHTLLPAHGRSHCVSKEISRHIHSESEVKSASVVALAIRAIGVGKPVPPGMLRVELHREFHECAAVVPVTRIGDQAAHKGSRGRVHAIQCDCPLGYWTKSQKVFLEEKRRSQVAVGKATGRPRVQGASGGSQRPPQRIGLIKNYKSKEVRLSIADRVRGTVESQTDDGKSEKLAEAIAVDNPLSRMTWEVTLQAGKRRSGVRSLPRADNPSGILVIVFPKPAYG